MADIQELPAHSIRMLGSSQVISSVFSVVKELVENSLDAQATAIEIKLVGIGKLFIQPLFILSG